MFASARKCTAASDQEVPVLVVGGSLVGLTTSALLALHGIRHTLIERTQGHGDGIGAQGALLLRPHGIIGWRIRGPHANPHARLNEVMRRLTFQR
jgi:2-polyprenyl-6-methoxyphenol hydroxylase-like FAD-dependent oxidoreductase